MKQKRFWVFAGDVYYPHGGARDFQAAFETEIEARAYGMGITSKSLDWFHIFDIEEGKILE